MQLTIDKQASQEFFTKLSKVWSNFKDYKYLEGINLSEEQIRIIEYDDEQLLIEGFAGTGKSLTLIYKLINVLIRQKNKKILYVTFNTTLIADTRKKLNSSKEYNEYKDFHSVKLATFHEIASTILKENKVINSGISRLTVEAVNKHRDISYRRIAAILDKYKNANSKEFKELKNEEKLYKTHDIGFVVDEIAWIKALGLIQKERYIEVDRIGRSHSIRLTRAQRNTIFKIYEEYQNDLEKKFNKYLDLEDYALKIIENNYLINEDDKFDYVFVDEVQDLDPMQIKALCLLTKGSIILSGDANQRIYKKMPIKYEDLGINIKERGRRKVLNKNFRSTAEIVRLANELVFFDNSEKLKEKLFVKSGDRPEIFYSGGRSSSKYLIRKIKEIQEEDPSKTIAIIHREEVKPKTGYKSNLRLKLESELLTTFSDVKSFNNKFEYNKAKQIFYTNVYDVKGLEFDYVFIVDFTRNYYPHLKSINKIKSENESKDIQLLNEDLAEFENKEKKLLYVAMTRAKEKLFLVANNTKELFDISSFIHDFNSKDYFADGFTKKRIENFKNREINRLQELLGDKYDDLYSNREENRFVLDNNKNISKKSNIENKEKEIKNQEGIKDSVIESKNIIVSEEKNINIDKIIEDEKKKIDKYVNVEEVINYFEKNNLEVIDKRDKKGALWIVGGIELTEKMNELEEQGFVFKYIKTGGRNTKNKPAWYLVSAN